MHIFIGNIANWQISCNKSLKSQLSKCTWLTKIKYWNSLRDQVLAKAVFSLEEVYELFDNLFVISGYQQCCEMLCNFRWIYFKFKLSYLEALILILKTRTPNRFYVMDIQFQVKLNLFCLCLLHFIFGIKELNRSKSFD